MVAICGLCLLVFWVRTGDLICSETELFIELRESTEMVEPYILCLQSPSTVELLVSLPQFRVTNTLNSSHLACCLMIVGVQVTSSASTLSSMPVTGTLTFPGQILLA